MFPIDEFMIFISGHFSYILFLALINIRTYTSNNYTVWLDYHVGSGDEGMSDNLLGPFAGLFKLFKKVVILSRGPAHTCVSFRLPNVFLYFRS